MANRYLLGFDVGSSSVKASLVNADSGKCVATAFYPEKEAPIMAVKAGWAEQDPQMWWDNAKLALRKIMADAGATAEDIKQLIDLITSDDNIFSVQAKMLQYNNKELIDDVGDEYNLLAWTKKTGENHKSEEYSQVCEIFSCCAGAAMYKKSIILDIGMFDDNFFAYMEDVDLAIRSRINGYKNLLCPQAVVYHIGSATSGSRYNEFKVKLAARNNVWVVYKNIPIPFKILNFIFLFIGFLIKYLFFFKKGFGSTYYAGIKEGLSTRNKINKVKFNSKNTKNYFKIEYRLIINTFKFLKK